MMDGHSMFTTAQAIAFGIAAIITFSSYQLIPAALEKIVGQSVFRDTVTAPIFTYFVRICGTDHLIMAGFMCGATLGIPIFEWMGWVIVGSAWIVAIVSLLSAIGIASRRGL